GSDITFENGWKDTWAELFVHQRLDQLRDEIMNRGLWSQDELDTYENVRETILEELEHHTSKPSLLHGVLWAGNYMFLTDGKPALFDHSPLYVDIEFYLGSSRVFRVLSQVFYYAYN